MNVVKPPQSLVAAPSKGFIKIFLAGSIEMGKAEDWQKVVEEYFKDSPYYYLYNPRRDDWDSSWEQSYKNPNFYQQVNWELNALDKCHEIIMYFDPNTKSPITLLELGLYADSGKLKVVCPDGYWRKGNVEIVCEKYGIPMFDNLKDLLNRFQPKL